MTQVPNFAEVELGTPSVPSDSAERFRVEGG